MSVDEEAPLSRAEINLRNSTKSTGPRTDAGKARVRFNALKHGLRAKTLVLPGEDRDAFQGRLDAWTADLKPCDDVDRFLVTRAVHASWMLDRAAHAVAARADADRLADANRLAQQAEEVTVLGSRLFREPVRPHARGLDPFAPPEVGDVVRRPDADDPDDPARIVIRLEATALGCAWLLDRWGELRQILEDGLAWQPHDRLRAIRMLGRRPLDAVDDRRLMRIYLDCWTLSRRDSEPHLSRHEEPEPGDLKAERRWLEDYLDVVLRQRGGLGAFAELLDELPPEEQEAYAERLRAREPMRDWDGNPQVARAGLLELAAGEEERLEAVLAGHLEREEAEAVAAQAFDASEYGERLRKYEQSNDRTLLRLVQALRKRHETAGAATSVAHGAAAPETTDPAGPQIPHGALGIDPVLGPVPLGPVGDEEVGDGGVGTLTNELPGNRSTDRLKADIQPTDSPVLAGCQPSGDIGNQPPRTPGTREVISSEFLPPREVPGTSADRTEPLPAEDPEADSTGSTPLATVGDEPAASLDRDAPPPASPIGRLAATVRRLAGAALALFALVSAAGLPTASASARSAPDRTVGPRTCPAPAPASAGWLCSSRPHIPHEPGDPDGQRHRPLEPDAEPG